MHESNACTRIRELRGMSSGTNARSVKLSATGEARLKAAAAHWRRAQKEFEIAVGAADAADLRPYFSA
jgi:hypothetical protein